VNECHIFDMELGGGISTLKCSATSALAVQLHDTPGGLWRSEEEVFRLGSNNPVVLRGSMHSRKHVCVVEGGVINASGPGSLLR
jgi:hypothetical protein